MTKKPATGATPAPVVSPPPPYPAPPTVQAPIPPCPVPLPQPPASPGWPERLNPPLARGPGGRFAKGNTGKRPGTRNRSTVAVEELMAGHVENVVEALILAAVNRGDTSAARLVLERALPTRRGRPVELEAFPKIESVTDVPRALAYLADAVARGKITPDEAAGVADVLNRYVAAVEASDHELRLQAIERAQEGDG